MSINYGFNNHQSIMTRVRENGL